MASAVMDRPFVPVIFDGAWPTSATLIGGPTRDLNVVTAHEGAASAVALLRVGAGGQEIAPSHAVTFLYVLSGAAHAEVEGATLALAAGDALRLDGAGQGGRIAAADDGALVYRIDIDLA